ncbi:MAG: OmpA family protein [Polyangia bacterium]
MREALVKNGSATICGLRFAFNKERLKRAESQPILRQILVLLTETPDLKLEIQVHSDSSVRDICGRRLTHDRAQEIKRWLVTQGIAAELLAAQGYGETRPLARSDTSEAAPATAASSSSIARECLPAGRVQVPVGHRVMRAWHPRRLARLCLTKASGCTAR